MPLVYFAAPLFSESELDFSAALTVEIERLGFTVFLPQRDGVDATKELWASMPRADLHRAIIEGHRHAAPAAYLPPSLHSSREGGKAREGRRGQGPSRVKRKPA